MDAAGKTILNIFLTTHDMDEERDIRFVRFLMERGADVNRADDPGDVRCIVPVTAAVILDSTPFASCLMLARILTRRRPERAPGALFSARRLCRQLSIDRFVHELLPRMELVQLKKMLATLKPFAKDAYKAAMAAREGKDAAAARKVVRSLFEHIPATRSSTRMRRRRSRNSYWSANRCI